ncbi:MAG TPA: putative Ig domain-containing protein [Verrucomicrobiae bacterium]
MTRLDLAKRGWGKGLRYAPKTPDHRLLGLVRLVACASLLCCELSTRVEAYVFYPDTSPPTVWPNGTIPMDLQLGGTLATPLMDGSTSWRSVATNALAAWNLHITTVKFTEYTQIPKAPAIGDGINQVFFDSTLYGQSFGVGVLAVEIGRWVGTTRTESDIVFNNTLRWDSYRGNLLPANGGMLWDFQRVALHEFGHTLGLGHPDQAGQTVVALMNSRISDLDHLTTDDTDGAFVLYKGAPSIVTQPQSQTVTAGAGATFSVKARGMTPLNYQWFFNGQPISTATGSSYSIARVQSGQAGMYTVVVSNSYGSVLSAPATLAISAATAFGVVGAPFSYQIVANNNPTWYSASGLPSGLSCDGTSGLISGTPTQTGIFSVHVEARNFFGSASATIPFTIADGAIVSATSAQGVIGAPFSYQIVADNSPTWYSASGLPSGLSCDGTSGLISGTPTLTGTFSAHVEARNFFGSASATISLTVANGAIISAASAQGIIGAPFSYQIVADNNPTWYSASGLASGLSCDGTSGLISGIPTQTGAFSVHVEARNFFGSASATISLAVTNGAIISAASAQGIIGAPFSYQIVADNNPTWYSASGLPSGLSCDGTSGLISGTPTQTGTFSAHVEARNFFGSASATISLTINGGAITGPSLTISRTGDSVLLTWSVNSTGFILEEIQVQQNTWTNSSTQVVVQGDENVVLIPIQSTARFYRLRK